MAEKGAYRGWEEVGIHHPQWLDKSKNFRMKGPFNYAICTQDGYSQHIFNGDPHNVQVNWVADIDITLKEPEKVEKKKFFM